MSGILKCHRTSDITNQPFNNSTFQPCLPTGRQTSPGKNRKQKTSKRYSNSPKRKPNVPNRKKGGKNISGGKMIVNN